MFTVNYKIRMNVIKFHGGGKGFDKWKWGMGRVLDDKKYEQRQQGEFGKSTVKAAMKKESVTNVLPT